MLLTLTPNIKDLKTDVELSLKKNLSEELHLRLKWLEVARDLLLKILKKFKQWQEFSAR